MQKTYCNDPLFSSVRLGVKGRVVSKGEGTYYFRGLTF